MYRTTLFAIFMVAWPTAAAIAQVPQEQRLRKAIHASDIKERIDERNPIYAGWRDAWDPDRNSPIVEFLNNPFDPNIPAPSLADLEDIVIKGEFGRFATGDPKTTRTSPASAALWLPSEAALVHGLADLVVQRARDELAYSFVLKLRDANYSPFIRAAFDQSLRVLGMIQPETFQTVMPLLRAAVVADLENLPMRVGRKDFRLQANLAVPAPIGLEAGSAIYPSIRAITKGVAPTTALSQLARLDTFQVAHKDLLAAFVLIGAVATDYGLHPEEIREELGGWPSKATFYLAFLGRDVAATAYGREDSAHPYTADLLGYLRDRETYLVGMIQQLEAMATAFSGVGRESDQLTSRSAIAGYFDLMVASAPLLPLSPDRHSQVRQALMDVERVHQSMTDRDYSALMLWITQELGLWNNSSDMRLVGFVVGLAGARTGDDVRRVLRTASAPVGSFRSKRNSQFAHGPLSASVAAYVGMGGGMENVISGGADFGFHAGVAMPVGLELSWGVPGGAIGLFAPILDLGTVANFRFGGGESVEPLPQIGLRQVLAPGLFAMIHAPPDLPFSVGFGFQVVNALRGSSSGSTRHDVVRFSLIGGIDATLFQRTFSTSASTVDAGGS